MVTEVYERDTISGWVRRKLFELAIDPSELLFGTGVLYDYDEDESSTTSIAYVDPDTRKLRLTATDLAIGDVLIFFWNFEIKASAQNLLCEARVQIDDNALKILAQPLHEGDEYSQFGGFAIDTITVAGSHFVDLDWRRASGGGGTAYVRRARFVIWKVEEI